MCFEVPVGGHIMKDEPEIIALRFTRVVFGLSSSPFLLNSTTPPEGIFLSVPRHSAENLPVPVRIRR